MYYCTTIIATGEFMSLPHYLRLDLTDFAIFFVGCLSEYD